MAYPTMTVVFADADGDEFPIAVPKISAMTPVPYIKEGRRRIRELVAEGKYRPNGELKFVRVEEES